MRKNEIDKILTRYGIIYNHTVDPVMYFKIQNAIKDSIELSLKLAAESATTKNKKIRHYTSGSAYQNYYIQIVDKKSIIDIKEKLLLNKNY